MSETPTLIVVDEQGPDTNDDGSNNDGAISSVDDTEARISGLEERLADAIAAEAEMTQHLEDHRSRIASLAGDLRSAHEDAARATVAEADAMRAEAAEDAEREATQITQQAFAKSKSILAAAEEEAAAILHTRQQELATLEAEARQRIEALEAEEDDLLGRVEVARTIYEELQKTLQAVAQASITELATAKTALAQMRPGQSTTPRRRSNDP